MTAEQKLVNLLKFNKLDSPFIFGELRNVEFINQMTGGDIRNAPDDDTRMYLTVTAYVRAGITLTRSLMLPKWGLYGTGDNQVLWDGYLNWKPGGDRQYTYEEALEKMRCLTKSVPDEQIIQRANEQMDYLEKAQALMGNDMHFMPVVCYQGLEGIYHSIGIENFAYLMADDPELISETLEAAFAASNVYLDEIVKRYKGPAVHFGDDLGMKNTTIFSPEWLRKYYLPKLKNICNHAAGKGYAFSYHSCGNINSILDDLLDCGINLLDPLEWTSGMMLDEIKEKTGNRMALSGNNNVNIFALGRPLDVRNETRRLLDTGGRGYMLPCYFPQNAPVENIYAWMDEVRNYKYE